GRRRAPSPPFPWAATTWERSASVRLKPAQTNLLHPKVHLRSEHFSRTRRHPCDLCCVTKGALYTDYAVPCQKRPAIRSVVPGGHPSRIGATKRRVERGSPSHERRPWAAAQKGCVQAADSG